MRVVYVRVGEVVTGASIDGVGLEASTVEGGVGTAEVELRANLSELECKHVRMNGTRAVSVVEERGLFEVRDGWVRQTQQAKKSIVNR